MYSLSMASRSPHSYPAPWIAVLGVAVLTAVGLALAIRPAAAEDTKEPSETSSDTEISQEQSDAEEPTSTSAEDPVIVMVEPEGPESRQVCRNVRVTGTRIPHRVCTTVAEREAEVAERTEEAQRFLRELQEQSAIVNPEREDPFTRSGLPGF